MTVFNTNKNSFLSSVHSAKTDFHAFASLGVAKDNRNEKQQKRSLLSNVSNAIDSIDTADFGIRIIVLKTKE